MSLATAPSLIHGLRPYRNWSRLVGDCVEVWLSDQHVVTGTVDEVTADGCILWVAAEGNRTRQLFDKFSGYEVRA